MNKTLEDSESSCPDCNLGSPYTSLDDFPACPNADGKYINCRKDEYWYYMDGFYVGYGPEYDYIWVNSIDTTTGEQYGPDGYHLKDCEKPGITCLSCEVNMEPCPEPDENGKYTAARTYNP